MNADAEQFATIRNLLTAVDKIDAAAAAKFRDNLNAARSAGRFDFDMARDEIASLRSFIRSASLPTMMSMDEHRENIEALMEMTGATLDQVIASTAKAIKNALKHGNTTDARIAEMKDMIAQASIMKREAR